MPGGNAFVSLGVAGNLLVGVVSQASARWGNASAAITPRGTLQIDQPDLSATAARPKRAFILDLLFCTFVIAQRSLSCFNRHQVMR